MLAIFFILIPFAKGRYIDMATSFYEDVTSLCLLTCDSPKYPPGISLARASDLNIAVSMVDVDEIGEDFSRFDACVSQRLSMGVLINANCRSFEKVMNYVSQNIMLDSTHKWFISNDVGKFPRQKVDKENVTAEELKIINNIENKKYETEMFLNNSTEYINSDTEFVNSNYIEDESINVHENLKDQNTSITIDVIRPNERSDNERRKIFTVLSKLNISVDADITYAELTDNYTYELYEIFNFGKIQGGSLVMKKIGTNCNKHDFSRNPSYVYYKRWNFNELNMRIVVVMSPVPDVFDPETILGRTRDPRVAVVTQIGTQVIQAVADIHNIKLVYAVVDRWVGNFQRNGTYVRKSISTPSRYYQKAKFRTKVYPGPEGSEQNFQVLIDTCFGISTMFKELQAVTNALYFGEADISPILRFMPPVPDKLGFVSTSVTSIETKFYYRIPSSGPGNFENQFLTPLTPGAWWGVLGLCAVCGVVLLTSSLFEERPFSLPYAFFSVFALVCQQFFEDTDEKGIKRSSSARKIAILVTGMSCVLIYNYYTSSVVSWLLSGPPPSINSLLELINSPLQPIFEDIGYTRSWLSLPDYYYNKRNAEDEEKLKKKMFKQMKKISIFRTVDEGIELVKQGGYAYHTETNGANDRISRTFDQRQLCDMGSLQVMEKTALMAAVQQHSPYKEFFNWSFMRVNERGIVSCVRARLTSHQSTCEGSSPRALALGGAAPAFVLLGGGYVVATLILMMEMGLHRYQSLK